MGQKKAEIKGDKMKKGLEVYGAIYPEQGTSLNFCVLTSLEGGMILDVGNFSVFPDGSIYGGIDNTFCIEEDNILLEAKEALLTSGLEEIVGTDIAREQIFVNNKNKVKVNEDLFLYPNKERYKRAREYVRNNGIVLLSTAEYGKNKVIIK